MPIEFLDLLCPNCSTVAEPDDILHGEPCIGCGQTRYVAARAAAAYWGRRTLVHMTEGTIEIAEELAILAFRFALIASYERDRGTP